MHKPLYKLWFSNSKLLMRGTSSPWSAELLPLCTGQTFTDEKPEQDSSDAHQPSIRQTTPHNCDHATQMQPEGIKSCSAIHLKAIQRAKLLNSGMAVKKMMMMKKKKMLLVAGTYKLGLWVQR